MEQFYEQFSKGRDVRLQFEFSYSLIAWFTIERMKTAEKKRKLHSENPKKSHVKMEHLRYITYIIARKRCAERTVFLAFDAVINIAQKSCRDRRKSRTCHSIENYGVFLARWRFGNGFAIKTPWRRMLVDHASFPLGHLQKNRNLCAQFLRFDNAETHYCTVAQ